MKHEDGALQLFEEQLGAWGVKLDRSRRDRLVEFAHLLSSYERANVIGTRDFNHVLLDHVLDSLSCCLFRPLESARRLVDVGSGGGLPGLPLAIAYPEAEVHLVESVGKKVSFLCEAHTALSVSNANPIQQRAEDLARSEGHRSVYDVATVRAVARLSVVAEYCVPLVKVGGHVISMKSKLQVAEIEEGERAAGMLGARIGDVIRVPLLAELGDKERKLVVIEKTRETSRRYPRKTGLPAKRPLGRTGEER